MKMRKMNTTKKMVESGALAIVRADVERACEIADGLIKGGVPVMEMSYTFNTAGDVIKALKEKYGEALTVGAGTVLDSETARHAILNGAEFIKAFPISDFYGPKLVKVFKTPIPDMPILASGGINLDNLSQWLENGVDVCGLGGLLTKGTSEEIAENASKIHEIITNFRNK